MQGQSTNCDHIADLCMRSKPTSRSCLARTSCRMATKSISNAQSLIHVFGHADILQPTSRGGIESLDKQDNVSSHTHEFNRANKNVYMIQTFQAFQFYSHPR